MMQLESGPQVVNFDEVEIVQTQPHSVPLLDKSSEKAKSEC